MQNSGRKKYHRNNVIGTLINDMPYSHGITTTGQIQFHAEFQFPLTAPADKTASSLFCGVCRSLHMRKGRINVR